VNELNECLLGVVVSGFFKLKGVESGVAALDTGDIRFEKSCSIIFNSGIKGRGKECPFNISVLLRTVGSVVF